MPASATRSELLKKRVDQFTRVLHAVEKGDVRALHLARVASRRLRELVPMLQLERATSRKVGRRLRKVTRRLGPVRELDVLLIQIDELHVAGRRGSGGLGRVGVRVSKARDEARKHLSEALPTSETARLARKLERLADDLAEKERASSKAAARNWRWAIEARVARRAQRMAAAVTAAGAAVFARPPARRENRGQATALRGRTLCGSGGRARRRGLERAEARPGRARPPSRCADADRSSTPDAGIAGAAERDRVARARYAGRVAGRRLPQAARALYATARCADGARRTARRTGAGVGRTRPGAASRVADAWTVRTVSRAPRPRRRTRRRVAGRHEASAHRRGDLAYAERRARPRATWPVRGGCAHEPAGPCAANSGDPRRRARSAAFARQRRLARARRDVRRGHRRPGEACSQGAACAGRSRTDDRGARGADPRLATSDRVQEGRDLPHRHRRSSAGGSQATCAGC